MTRRSNSRIPSYRRHKPTDQAVVTINGQDHYLGKWNTAASRAAYDRIIAEWTSNGRTIPASDANDLTIVELCAAFYRHAKGYYRSADGTVTSEPANILKAIQPLKQLYGRTLAVQFGPLALQAVRQAMINLNWCRTSINRNVGRIKLMFKWAVASELLPPSVFHGLQAVGGLRAGRSSAKESVPVKPVPEAFITAVLGLVTPPVAVMIQLQLLTGARPGEIAIMRGCDLETGGKIWTYKPMRHKSAYRGHERTIYLGPKAQEVVKPFLTTTLDAYLFSPRAAKEAIWAERRTKRQTPMTPSQARRRRKQNPKRAPRDCYTITSYGRAISKACVKAGVPVWGPHRLRHNRATELRREFGLDVARVILGHRSPAVTEVYAELDHAKALEIMGRVG